MPPRKAAEEERDSQLEVEPTMPPRKAAEEERGRGRSETVS